MIFTAAMVYLLAQAASAPAAPRAPQAPQPVTKAAVDARAKAVFAKVDANHDGKVDRAEADRFQAAAIAEERGAAFNHLDSNHDGSISRAEWDAVAPKPTRNPWFETNDIDKNGVVTEAEAVAKQERAFDAIDANHDGTVTPEEARAFNNRRPATPPKK